MITQVIGGQHTEAGAVFERILKLQESLVHDNPENVEWQSDLGITLNNLGSAKEKLGRCDEALKFYRRAISHQSLALEGLPQAAAYRRRLDQHYKNLISVLRTLGQTDESATAVSDRLKLWPGNADELFAAACELASCLTAVDLVAGEPTLKQQRKRREFSDEAMKTLRRSVDAGFREVKRVKEDADLDPLRSRSDFQPLILLIMDSIFPANPFVR